MRSKLSLAIALASAITLSYTLTQCTIEPIVIPDDAGCDAKISTPDMARGPDMATPRDLAQPPDLAVRRTTYAWWEFTRWWYLIGHGGGYCAPDDGNFTLVMDAFCKGYGFKWAVLNGARPDGDCMIWSGQVAPVYDTIVCGP